MPKDHASEGHSTARNSSPTSAATDRRSFLKAGAALSAAAGGMLVPAQAAAQSEGDRLAVPPGMKEQGNPIVSPPYGVPSPFEKNVVRRFRDVRVTNTAATSFAPLQDMFGIITPNGLCFERHH